MENRVQQHYQRGIGLIEMMVALLVLAIGLLGMAGLTSTSVRQSQVAYSYSQAMFLAQDIAERALTNRGELAQYQINFTENGDGSIAEAKCTSGSCTPAELARWDVKVWKKAVADRLPSGDARVVLDSSAGKQELQITIQYSDRDVPLDANGEPDLDAVTKQELTYNVEL